MSRLVFDLETNGLLNELTTIWSLVIKDLDSGEVISCVPKAVANTKDNTYKTFIESGLRLLQEADEIIGHNIIKFDLPAIQKLYPSFKPKGKIMDTLVLSKLVYPDISGSDYGRVRKGKFPKDLIGSYSLKAFGYRLGEYKGEHNDWSKWTPEMQAYCEQDVVVTEKLYYKIMAQKPSEESIDLETRFCQIINLQEQRGVYFDRDQAIKLYSELCQKRQELEEELKSIFEPIYVNGGTFTPKKDNRAKGYYKGATFSKLIYEEFKPSSTQHISKRLINKYGWKPTAFTPSGLPKVSEEILKELPYPECPKLIEYLVVQKIIGFVAEGKQGWLKQVTPSGRIHGSVNTGGAVTGRCTHSSPNLSQCPACNSPYGKECRSLFRATPGMKQVGCDAAGLELRCLAHYMAKWDGGAYAKTILSGKKEDGTDIHTVNQKAAGLPDRDTAKRFIYGLIYGAGDEKVGSIIGKGAKEGRAIKASFFKTLPALKNLMNYVKQKIEERGYLIGVDRRRLKVREGYKGLNVALQSAGALVMKKALIILNDDMLGLGWNIPDYRTTFYLPKDSEYDLYFILNIHDEYQAEMKPELVEEYKKLATKAITKAGQHFKFRCELDGEVKEGLTWAETH